MYQVTLARRFTRRRRSPVPAFTSIKNQFNTQDGLTGTTTTYIVAKAVNTPLSTNASDVSNGCSINAIWVSIDVCGLAGTGVINIADFYLMKNPGANLTAPAPIAWGTSNEKKFIIKSWRAMIMRNQDGNVPYHWEGWIKIPRNYQRMGTDDTWFMAFACTSAVTAHMSFGAIYKWKR